MTLTFPTTKINRNKLEIFSEEIRKEAVRQGGRRKNDWKGKVLVVDEKRVQEEVRRSRTVLLCKENSREKEGENFRVARKSKAT